jgi:hypothetical protein
LDPDPLVRGTDLGIQILIRTKMSRIPNTVFSYAKKLAFAAGSKMKGKLQM